jgi:hypothetical protein
MIELAVEFGFIIGEMEKFVLSMYEDHNSEEGYPFESVQELADEALTWLNCGDNDGPDRQIKFQNNPPVIPEGHAWGWNDGDFGLYPYVLFNIGQEDSDGHRKLAEDCTMPQARRLLANEGARPDIIEKLLDQSPDDMALQAGGFIVEAVEN